MGTALRERPAVTESAAYYEAAIETDEQRIAFNALTQQCIDTVHSKRREKHFTSLGVDALGSARAYLVSKATRGPNHPATRSLERVLDIDMMSALIEETEDTHLFSESYPVVNGEIMMGDVSISELAAAGTLDERVAGWYFDRSFIETREGLVAAHYFKTGELLENDLVTISHRSTTADADEYFKENCLMVRTISYDPATQRVTLSQLMVPSVGLEVIATLFQKLEVVPDDKTIPHTSDEATKFLATQLRVKKGELQHAAADIGFLIDTVVGELCGGTYLFGEKVERVEGNPYADMYILSKAKEERRAEAKEYLKQRFCELVLQENDIDVKQELSLAFQIARGIVADIEGLDYVRERYGESAAQAWQEKQSAVNKGDWGDAEGANNRMQAAMGDIIICHQSLSVKPNKLTAAEDFLCRRLPTPGEKATCPACGRVVRVAGSSASLRCPRPQCKLADPKVRRRHQQQKQQVEAKAKLRKEHAKKLSKQPLKFLNVRR